MAVAVRLTVGKIRTFFFFNLPSLSSWGVDGFQVAKPARLGFFNHLLSYKAFRLTEEDDCCSFHWNPDTFYAFHIDNSVHNRQLKQIHARLLAIGLRFNEFLVTKLVNASANLGEIAYARQLFDDFPRPDVFLWNAIIRGYSRQSLYSHNLEMYSRMQMAWVSSDSFTFPYVLKACSFEQARCFGRAVHGQIFRLGFDGDSFVQNGLIAFYAKNERVLPARTVFDRLAERNIVSWTSMISGYAQNGHPIEALKVYCQMGKLNVKPDWIALVSAISAYTDVGCLEHGKSVHSCVVKMGLEVESDLLIALTTMYANCGQVETARLFFNQMKAPNLILWNSMISGYAKNGYAEEAVGLFQEMIRRKIEPDSISVRSAVAATAQVGSLEQARWLGEYIQKSTLKDDVFVNTALIDMYAKCGSLDLARSVFDCLSDKDVVVWSAMIVGYGLHGRGQEAIDLYHEMVRSGVYPNDVTFLGILMACNHAGLVEEGWWFFCRMSDYRIEPRHQHYACVVDLLGRAGHVDRAYEFITNMRIQPGVTVWGALLSACKIHRRVQIGEYAAQQLFSIDPANTGHHVQLSNLYAAARLWDRVAEVRIMMKEKGMCKDLGYSTVEVKGKLEVFRMGDKSHPRYKDIYSELESLEQRLKMVGFIPHTDSSLHDLNVEESEEFLCNHSERLAIAYGLISTPPETTLRITKNLRACVNCHAATKVISKLANREIIVRDANRFHHFKDGACSCGDYW